MNSVKFLYFFSVVALLGAILVCSVWCKSLTRKILQYWSSFQSFEHDSHVCVSIIFNNVYMYMYVMHVYICIDIVPFSISLESWLTSPNSLDPSVQSVETSIDWHQTWPFPSHLWQWHPKCWFPTWRICLEEMYNIYIYVYIYNMCIYIYTPYMYIYI